MKTLLYILCSLFFIVAGGGILRQSIQPPYFANTFRLLQLDASTIIHPPLPLEKATVSATVPFLTDTKAALLGVFLLVLGLVMIYFFPSFIGRKHRERLSILILNLFLGWSFLGWVIALIWAVTKDPIFLVEPPQLSLQLRELGELHKSGVLEAKEFKRLKTQMIQDYANGPSSKKTAPYVIRKCPHCSREYQFPPKLIGKAALCKNCRKRFKL